MAGTVGTVQTERVTFETPLKLESGATLSPFTIAYQTYGKLNEKKSNAILICHALSGDAHAAGVDPKTGKRGWWDTIIGPGKAFDTDRYFIISSNVIGGCKGSTGPSSIDTKTGKPYGITFPVITIQDMVRGQKRLVEHLGISRLAAVAGGSMGGMQVLTWSTLYPEIVRKVICIASTARSSPQQIAFNEVGRQAIMSDPVWAGGDYPLSDPPIRGLSLARMIGHITYLSDEAMHEKFGRRLYDPEGIGYDFMTEFQVESYLHHQGNSFTRRFDPNSYLYITRALDYFDLSEEGSLAAGLAVVKASFLIISVSTDWLYPPYQSEEIVSALTQNGADVQYCEIRSKYGHDAFLLESGQLNYIIGDFLDRLLVKNVMDTRVPTINEGASILDASKIMIDDGVNHLPVVKEGGEITGIVTSWDIAKAVAFGHRSLDEIMSRNVQTASPDEPVRDAARRMQERSISALPVIDSERRVVGLISSEAISRLVGRCT
ncbi:MAG: homoserine O-acetyltransferase [Methanocalculus sp.]|uniref:homoserine O-acetyltransferase MetX n=1 Tax=Methanocalculus sp. TaxID=2004547 RepID=UPI0027199CF8|nr:homoserine O-acetyltransferase [Methanocalculus sp.]MDO9539970.1 homoserine O-acetyltransferase [Methanocalculus sp.]